jgi:UDP-glucose 4-epimerase
VFRECKSTPQTTSIKGRNEDLPVQTQAIDTFRNKKVLITGGLGFIGSNLAHRLVELGATVTLVDSMIPECGGTPHNIAPIERRVLVSLSDVCDEQRMCDLVRGMDFLFNLAGLTSHLDSMINPYADLEINCRAQISTLEACRKANPDIKIVFASTRQVYGKPDFLPVDEAHVPRPMDVNGINKYAGETYHMLYSSVYGIRSCALRLTNTYGPHMRVKDARQTFLGFWIRQLLEGKPIEVWDGRQLRDFTYVDDAVQAFLLAAMSDRTDGHIYNVGGEPVISLLDLAALLREVHGRGDFVIVDFPLDRKRIDIGDYYANYDRIQRELGWRPAVPLGEGLAKTIAFYRKHLDLYL